MSFPRRVTNTQSPRWLEREGLLAPDPEHEVEIAARAAGKFSANDIGVDLMDQAFHKRTGPLTDTTIPESEREATRFLFRGSIGRYKNPHSHRSLPIRRSSRSSGIIDVGDPLAPYR